MVVIASGLLLAALIASGVFALLGSDYRSALAAGAGLVGILLVLGGVAAFSRTGAVRRTRGALVAHPAEERREAELLAAGLLGFGIAFSVLALVIG